MPIIQEMLQKIRTNQDGLLNWPDTLFLLLISFFILSGVTLAPFHGDESTYIWMSRDYDKIIKQGDLGAIRYDPEKDLNNLEQRLRLSIGSILEFSIGIVRDITNTDINMNNKWNWGIIWDENISNGNMPDPQLMLLARSCSAVMGTLGVVFFFLTTYKLFSSRLVAWTATLLLATQGDVVLSFRRAMQEGPKFLFLLITLYIGTHILKALKNGGSRRTQYVLLGIASGFTLAAKQDTAPMLAAISLALAVELIIEKRSMKIIFENILYLGGAAILAFAFFLILMPIFWGWWETVISLIGFATLLFQIPVLKVRKSAKPLALASFVLVLGMSVVFPSQWRRFFAPVEGMAEVRKTLLDSQIGNLVRFNLPYLDTAKNKARFFLSTTFTSNVMYMEVASFDVDPVNKQIAVYEASAIHGRIGSPILDALIALLFFIGAWVLLKYFSDESLMMVSLFVVTAIFLFVSIPLPWHRYFLIMQIPYSLIAGVGAEKIWTWGKLYTKQRIRP